MNQEQEQHEFDLYGQDDFDYSLEEDLEQGIPQPDEISKREKDDAMGGYLMMFAAWAVGLPLPIINLIAALIYYHVNKDKSKFVQFHALQSLLSQLPTTLMNAGLMAWFLSAVFGGAEFSQAMGIYAGMTVLANLMYIVFSMIAAFKAQKGKFYYFIGIGKLAFRWVFGRYPKSKY